MENSKNQIVLEPSSNTHVLESTSPVVVKDENGHMVVKTNGPSTVSHGEHGVLVTNKTFVSKFNQREKNPLTGMWQKAVD